MKFWIWWWFRWWRIPMWYSDRIYAKDQNGRRLKRTGTSNPNWGMKHYYKKTKTGWVKKG